MSLLAATREFILANAPDSLSDDERESYWISEWVGLKQEAAAEAGMSIADPGVFIREKRALIQQQHEALQQSEAALATLRTHLTDNHQVTEDQDTSMGPTLWTVDAEEAEGIGRSIEHLASVISRLRARTRPQEHGNMANTRSMYVKSTWPILKELGYSMRSASRILSDAFLSAGLEPTDTSQTVYQTIRNLTR